MMRQAAAQPAIAANEFVADNAGNGTFRVHSGVYTDAAVFEAEMDAFYRRGWVYLAHESQMRGANDFMTCRLARQPVLLTRTADGTVRGFLNRCRHRGAVVCRADHGNAKTFTCFYHSWTYGNSGALEGVSGPDGFPPDFDTASLALAPLPRLESYRGLLFGSLSAEGPSLAEHLGEAAGYIDLLLDQAAEPLRVVAGATAYEFKGNWKLQVENALDYYHLPFVHRSFMEIRRARGEEVSRGSLRGLSNDVSIDIGNGHGTVVTFEPNGERAQHLFIFPNVVFLESPAPQIRLIEPVAPNETHVRGYFYAQGKADTSVKLRHYERFYGPIGFGTPDDIEVFHSCMDGYSIDGAPWNDLSRGLHREVTKLAMPWPLPFVAAGNITDDTFLRGFYRNWAARLSRPARPAALQSVR